MTAKLEQKSSVDEIKQRFYNDVERFSNIETGQTATIDAPLAMELITQAAFKSTKKIQRVLDIGCGAGNNTIKWIFYGKWGLIMLNFCIRIPALLHSVR